MKTMRGFTLFELIIVLAIIGILAGLGIPSLQQMTAHNRLVTNANNLVYTFQLARSEAITRVSPVDVVAATGGWQNGWQIEVPVPGTPCGSATAAIKSWEAMVGSPAVTWGTTCYRFDAQGRLNASGTLSICDNRAGESGRMVNLNKIGRITISTVTC